MADFGVAQRLTEIGQELSCPERKGTENDYQERFNDMTVETAGTHAFFSPEMLSGGSFSSRRCDEWALSVTLFSVVTKKLPLWKSKNDPSDRHIFSVITEDE